MNHVRPFVTVNLLQPPTPAGILQLAAAAEGICLGRLEEAISSTRALVSAAAHLVPLTGFSLESWPLLPVVCFLRDHEAL